VRWEVYQARLLAAQRDTAEFEFFGQKALTSVLGADIALALGTLGHVSALAAPGWDHGAKKTRSAGTLTPFMHSPAALVFEASFDARLDGIPALAVSGPDTVRIRSGQSHPHRANLSPA